VRDAQGNVLGVYERSLPKVGGTYTDQIKLKEQNMYGSSRLGTKNPDLLLTSKSYTFTSYNGLLLAGTAGAQTTTTVSLTSVVHKINQKVFEMSNHLGNVLVTVSDARVPVNGTGSVSGYGAMVKAGMEYSAFGVVRRTIVNNGNYRYGFNGMERNDEKSSGMYSTEYRELDARLGRWTSVDPRKSLMPSWSPYNFSADRPIQFKDAKGDVPVIGTIIGAVVGAVKEIGTQTITNGIQNINTGKSFFTDWGSSIDWADVLISTGEGALAGTTLGLSLLATTTASSALKASIDWSGKDGFQMIGGPRGHRKDIRKVALDFGTGMASFGLGKLLPVEGAANIVGRHAFRNATNGVTKAVGRNVIKGTITGATEGIWEYALQDGLDKMIPRFSTTTLSTNNESKHSAENASPTDDDIINLGDTAPVIITIDKTTGETTIESDQMKKDVQNKLDNYGKPQ
jgi:RHS repeat-associated protein